MFSLSDIPLVVLRVLKRGTRIQKWALGIMLAAFVLALLTLGVNQALVHAPEESAKYVYIPLFGLAFIAYLFLSAAVDLESKIEGMKRVERAENAVAEHPLETRPLWDLARTRLELYFERNLAQIATIFLITVVVMFAGF